MNEQDWMSAVAGAREEGLEQGLEQGLVRQQLASLKEYLNDGLPEKTILRYLKINEEQLAALKQQL